MRPCAGPCAGQGVGPCADLVRGLSGTTLRTRPNCETCVVLPCAVRAVLRDMGCARVVQDFRERYFPTQSNIYCFVFEF